jgi:hypothetical protein
MGKPIVMNVEVCEFSKEETAQLRVLLASTKGKPSARCLMESEPLPTEQLAALIESVRRSLEERCSERFCNQPERSLEELPAAAGLSEHAELSPSRPAEGVTR